MQYLELKISLKVNLFSVFIRLKSGIDSVKYSPPPIEKKLGTLLIAEILLTSGSTIKSLFIEQLKKILFFQN